MNKKLFIGGCGLAAIAGNVFAADEEYSYFTPCVALKGGYSLLGKRDDIKYKGGFAGAVEMGVSYDAWRAALELGYKGNKTKGNKYSYIPGGKAKLDAPATTKDHFVENSIFKAGNANQPFTGALNGDWYLHDITRVEMTKLTALTGMINVYYDYPMTEAWSLYAGIGLGVAKVAYTVKSRMFKDVHNLGCTATIVPGANNPLPNNVATAYNDALNTIFNDVKDVKTELSKTVFAWQLMAGVAYEINENWKVTLGYKFFNTGKVDFNGTKIKTPRNHTAEAGLIWAF